VIMKLEGRVAIVTGAGQGIGRAIAEKLREEGASVMVADKNAETAEKTAAEIGAVAQVTDVSDEAQVAVLAEAAMGQFGTIDILINDAAIVPFVPWEQLDFAEWRRVMSVNIDGVFLMCQAVYPHMKAAGYGRIVNISSNVVTAGTPNMAHYVASKGAVFAFTRSLATEVGAHGITVNAVAPGLTASEGALGSPHAEGFDFVVSLQSIPRRAVPADIAPAVAFLASEEAHWITGQMLTADGGHTRH